MKKRKIRFKVSPAHQSQRRIFGQTFAYLMGSIRFPFRNKWGISDAVELRRAQVDKDISGPVYTVFFRQIPWGWACEQLVHFIYYFQNAPIRKTTGGTEWFYNINPIFGSLFIYACFKMHLEPAMPVYICAFISPFIWIDGLLWLLLFRAFGWFVAGALAASSWYLFTHA